MTDKIKLLLTQDNNENTAETLRAFENHNIATSICNKDGEDLIAKICNLSPDVVMMDLFMTRVDSIGVMRAIKDKDIEHKPMFIIYSTFDSPVLQREVMSAGASYFVLKPYNANDLADIIVKLNKQNYVKEKGAVKSIYFDSFSLEVKVTEILHQIGVPAHIKGYHYLRDSIIMSIEQPEIINAVT